MKKIFFVVTFLIVSLLQAEEKKFNIKSDVLSFAFDGYSAEVEYIINNDYSIMVGSSYSSMNFMDMMQADYRETLLKVNWYYENGAYVDSYYLGLALGYQSQYMMVKDANLIAYDGTSSGYFAGAYWGVKWIWESGFNIAWDIGYGVSTAPEISLKASDDSTYSSYGREATVGGQVTMFGGINFGWMF